MELRASPSADAVASIIITAINIIAGFLIGVLQHGMDLQRALQTYTVLTIGDGLVTVIPALMVSVCGALIVTRASSDNQLGSEMRRQLFSNPQPLLLAGGVLCVMAMFPGLPTGPFLMLGSGVAWMRRAGDSGKLSSLRPCALPLLRSSARRKSSSNRFSKWNPWRSKWDSSDS